MPRGKVRVDSAPWMLLNSTKEHMKHKSRNSALSLKAFNLLVLFFTAAAVIPAQADGLIDGKCGIAEIGSAFSRCTAIIKHGNLSILANNGGNLILQARSSEILRIGLLSDRAEALSPGLKGGLRTTLSTLGVSESDARRSSNVRIIQVRDTSMGIISLLFIADRSPGNLDQLNANLRPIERDNSLLGNVPSLIPADTSQILDEFNRAFQRIQGLYEALMFDEADRVFDRTQADLRNFSKRFGSYQGAPEVMAVLESRTRQLESLRSFKYYDYQLSRAQAEQRYNRIQRERAEAEAREKRRQYLLAVEYRKAAEANARKWWAIWMATRPTVINNMMNTNVIITR